MQWIQSHVQNKYTMRFLTVYLPDKLSMWSGLTFLGGWRCLELQPARAHPSRTHSYKECTNSVLTACQQYTNNIQVTVPNTFYHSLPLSTLSWAGCFARGESAFGISTLQVWQDGPKPKRPKQHMQISMPLRPVLHCDLCAAGLIPNVCVLVAWNSLERSDLRSRWGDSSFSWFYGSGSLWRFQLFKHAFQTNAWDGWNSCLSLWNLAKFVPRVAAPPMEKGWQCRQAVHRWFFCVCSAHQLHGRDYFVCGILFHYRSTLDTLGARGHGTWHVFSQCERNRVLLGPKVQGRVASIHSRRALAYDPLVVLSY